MIETGDFSGPTPSFAFLLDVHLLLSLPTETFTYFSCHLPSRFFDQVGRDENEIWKTKAAKYTE